MPTKRDYQIAAILATLIMGISAMLWGGWAAVGVAFGLSAILQVAYRLLTGKWLK